MGATTTIQITQKHEYQFDNQFGDPVPALLSDQPAPLGLGAGPSPMHFLCAAVGNCLTASLLFAFKKFKQDPAPISCTVTAEVGRNAEGRARVTHMQVRLQLGKAVDQMEYVERVLSQFEEFCTVTQSVRVAIPVALEVIDATGAVLKQSQ